MQFYSIICKPNSQFCEHSHDTPLGMLHRPAGLRQGRASPDLLLTEPLQAPGRGWAWPPPTDRNHPEFPLGHLLWPEGLKLNPSLPFPSVSALLSHKAHCPYPFQ